MGWGISRRVGVVGVEVGVNIENAMILFTVKCCDIDIERRGVMLLREFWGQGWEWAGFGVGHK